MHSKKENVVIQFRSGRGDTYNAKDEHEKNVIGTRISDARKRAGMTLNEFSQLLKNYGVDVAGGAISKWEIGKTLPNPYQLIAVCHALRINDPLRQFSDSYMPALNEEGLRKVSEYIDDLISSGKYEPKQINNSEIRIRQMPISNLRASAGTGSLLDEGSFETESFSEADVPERADFGLRISGDSMEPVYHDGQIVWVERCQTLSSGEVGIVIYDGNGFIKVYEEQEPDENHYEEFVDSYGTVHPQIALISYNSKKYDPIYINPTMNTPFKVVGRVLH